MVEIEVKKERLEFNLMPFNYNECIIFTTNLGAYKGLFGVGKNELVFFNYDDLPETLKIQVPENIEEITELLSFADWCVTMASATMDLKIDGVELDSKSIIEHLYLFLDNFLKNKTLRELAKYGQKN